MGKSRYCDEHPRVKLERGKCIACGEVEYEVPKKGLSINMQVAYLSGFVVVICLVIIILNLV